MVDNVKCILMRHAAQDTPETRLAVAVLCQAVIDTRPHDVAGEVKAREWDAVRADANTFLAGDGLNTWAELAGLEPGFVRAIAQRETLASMLQRRM